MSQKLLAVLIFILWIGCLSLILWSMNRKRKEVKNGDR